MTVFVESKMVLFGDFILYQVEFYEHRNCLLNFYRPVDADLYRDLFEIATKQIWK